jgi:hypothetical protein
MAGGGGVVGMPWEQCPTPAWGSRARGQAALASSPDPPFMKMSFSARLSLPLSS